MRSGQSIVAFRSAKGYSFAETVTADAQGRFRIEAFVPGIETEITVSIEGPNRPGVQLNGGNALQKPALKSGEVRDLGDVQAKEKAQKLAGSFSFRSH
jgi:hypothetical protein